MVVFVFFVGVYLVYFVVGFYVVQFVGCFRRVVFLAYDVGIMGVSIVNECVFGVYEYSIIVIVIKDFIFRNIFRLIR